MSHPRISEKALTEGALGIKSSMQYKVSQSDRFTPAFDPGRQFPRLVNKISA